jgi:hypothetical protein
MIAIGSAPGSVLVVVVVGSSVDVASAAVGDLVGGSVGDAVGNPADEFVPSAGIVFGPVADSAESAIGSAGVAGAIGTVGSLLFSMVQFRL